MNKQNQLSNNARTYLEAYNKILCDMIENMTNAELNNSISHNFIVQMIPHHMAAIEMSCNILKYTSDEAVREIASNIVSEQTKSIENMKEIIDRCSCVVNSRQELCWFQDKMDSIMNNMFYKMQNACATNRLNCDFLREMIPHHMGAVQMSETVLNCKICPELRPILRSIITSQRRGIFQMQKLLNCLGCEN